MYIDIKTDDDTKAIGKELKKAFPTARAIVGDYRTHDGSILIRMTNGDSVGFRYAIDLAGQRADKVTAFIEDDDLELTSADDIVEKVAAAYRRKGRKDAAVAAILAIDNDADLDALAAAIADKREALDDDRRAAGR